MRAWITGAGGLIGNTLVQTAATHAPLETARLDRVMLDLTDFSATPGSLRERPPCDPLRRAQQIAACQANPSAHLLNVESPVNLLNWRRICRSSFFPPTWSLTGDGEITWKATRSIR